MLNDFYFLILLYMKYLGIWFDRAHLTRGRGSIVIDQFVCLMRLADYIRSYTTRGTEFMVYRTEILRRENIVIAIYYFYLLY